MDANEIKKLLADAKARRDKLRQQADADYKTDIEAIRRIGGRYAGSTGKPEPKPKSAGKTIIIQAATGKPADSLAGAIRDIIDSFDSTATFNVKAVLKRIRNEYPQFAGIHKEIVSASFRRFVQHTDVLERVQPGSGRRPTTYRRRQKTAHAATG